MWCFVIEVKTTKLLKYFCYQNYLSRNLKKLFKEFSFENRATRDLRIFAGFLGFSLISQQARERKKRGEFSQDFLSEQQVVIFTRKTRNSFFQFILIFQELLAGLLSSVMNFMDSPSQ